MTTFSIPRDYIYLWHILIVGPLLLYLGFYGPSGQVPQWVWWLLILLGIGVIAYQGYLFIDAKSKKKDN